MLRPGGAVLFYDMRVRNPLSPNLRAMPRSKVNRFFPGYDRSWTSLTVVPQISRRLGPATQVLYPVLSVLRAPRTHALALFEKPS